jgi:hypothetical protein
MVSTEAGIAFTRPGPQPDFQHKKWVDIWQDYSRRSNWEYRSYDSWSWRSKKWNRVARSLTGVVVGEVFDADKAVIGAVL